jgi:small-conductance mechanosensitive channel
MNFRTDSTRWFDWALALGVLIATGVVVAFVRTLLKRLKGRDSRRWAAVHELAPSLSNLIYIVGLHVFSEIAPLTPSLDKWLDNAIYVVAVLILLGLLRRADLIGIEWSSTRSESSRTLQLGFIPLMKNVITLFVFFSGAIMILKRFNYDVMSLLTALGVGSLAVGLAAKETLSNMISGFTLIIDGNLRPGDRINLGGTVGDVEEIGLRSTRMKMGDGNTLIVPNSELVNTKLLNLSMPNREVTCSSVIRVPYSVPFPKLKALCLDVLQQVEKIDHNSGKWVQITSLAEGFQTINVGF